MGLKQRASDNKQEAMKAERVENDGKATGGIIANPISVDMVLTNAAGETRREPKGFYSQSNCPLQKWTFIIMKVAVSFSVSFLILDFY